MIGFTAAAVAGPQRGSGGVFVMLSCLHFLFYSTFFSDWLLRLVSSLTKHTHIEQKKRDRIYSREGDCGM